MLREKQLRVSPFEKTIRRKCFTNEFKTYSIWSDKIEMNSRVKIFVLKVPEKSSEQTSRPKFNLRIKKIKSAPLIG